MKVSGQLHARPPYPQEGMLVPIDYKARWVPRSVWKILKEEEKNKRKIFCFDRVSNSGSSSL
jgi:hypothetical protein